MKKWLLMLFAGILLTGCGNNKQEINDEEEPRVCVATIQQVNNAVNKVLDYFGITDVKKLSTASEDTILGCSVVITFSYDEEKFEFVVDADNPNNFVQSAVD